MPKPAAFNRQPMEKCQSLSEVDDGPFGDEQPADRTENAEEREERAVGSQGRHLARNPRRVGPVTKDETKSRSFCGHGSKKGMSAAGPTRKCRPPARRVRLLR